jgi:hypothetical protein
MGNIPYRVCSLCRVGMEPGQPYWAWHQMGGRGTYTYCEECVALAPWPVPERKLPGNARVWRGHAPSDPLVARPSEVKPERSEP